MKNLIILKANLFKYLIGIICSLVLIFTFSCRSRPIEFVISKSEIYYKSEEFRGVSLTSYYVDTCTTLDTCLNIHFVKNIHSDTIIIYALNKVKLEKNDSFYFVKHTKSLENYNTFITGNYMADYSNNKTMIIRYEKNYYPKTVGFVYKINN